MGYYISDIAGYVADGPSLTGWARLRDEVLLVQGGPATRAFVEAGETEDLRAVAHELSQMRVEDGTAVATSLRALDDAVRRCRGLIILGTGVSDWPDEGDEGDAALWWDVQEDEP